MRLHAVTHGTTIEADAPPSPYPGHASACMYPYLFKNGIGLWVVVASLRQPSQSVQLVVQTQVLRRALAVQVCLGPRLLPAEVSPRPLCLAGRLVSLWLFVGAQYVLPRRLACPPSLALRGGMVTVLPWWGTVQAIETIRNLL